MSSVYLSGSLLPTLNTQHVIGTIPSAAPAFYLSNLDIGALRAGDIVVTGIITQAAAWGTASLGAPGGFANEAVAQIRWSPPIPIFHGGQFFIKQTAGTPRWINFEVISI